MSTPSEQPDRPDLEKAAIDAEFFAITANIESNPFSPKLEPAPELEPEEFIPPEPAPIPAPADTIARFAWAGVLGGPLLAIIAYVFGFPRFIATFAMLAFVAGFAVLIWRRVESHDEDDDGARL